jgi:hypothetical protein
MLDENNLFQHAAVTSSAYVSMAAFTAAANMYNSVNYFGCTGTKYFDFNEFENKILLF